MNTEIKLLLLDVDGVLTDGAIILDDDGRQTKHFHVTDGFGIRLWLQLGLSAGIVTGRTSSVVRHRAAELGIPAASVIQNSKDKLADAKAICTAVGIPLAQTAFIGDDWPDLTVMKAAGYAIAPANAHRNIKAIAKHTTTHAGGHGAVREAIEHLLTRMGRFDEALRLYDPSHPASPHDGPTRPTF